MAEHSEPWFFVVRVKLGKEHYSVERGDFRGTQRELKEKPPKVQRFELPQDYRPTLDEAVAAWKRGVRIKAVPRPKSDPPKTSNPYKARFLAKLRANADPSGK